MPRWCRLGSGLPNAGGRLSVTRASGPGCRVSIPLQDHHRFGAGQDPVPVASGSLCSASQIYRVARRFLEEELRDRADKRESRPSLRTGNWSGSRARIAPRSRSSRSPRSPRPSSARRSHPAEAVARIGKTRSRPGTEQSDRLCPVPEHRGASRTEGSLPDRQRTPSVKARTSSLASGIMSRCQSLEALSRVRDNSFASRAAASSADPPPPSTSGKTRW